MSLTMNRRFRAGGVLIACAVLTAAALPARAVERNLAGVAIYSSAQQVIRKYGNPTYVLTGGQTFTGVGSAASPGSASGQGIGPLPPMNPSSLGGLPPQGMPPFQGGGRGKFGGYNPGAMPSAYSQQQTGQPTALTGDTGEVTYVYQKSDGTTYQFLLAPNGKVIQITALGRKAQDARTSRGIALGSTYSQVLAKYGNPESIQPTGLVTLLTYADRAHVAFQLVANRVVGINVAAMQ